jgi:ATP-binding cassette, subfamily B (MDR/TAP), member 1
LTYADGVDKLLMVLGYLTAIITGIGLPSFVFLFGDIVDEFGKSGNIIKVITPICIELVIIGSIMWVTSYFYFTFLVIMSERLGRKTRIAYLRAILQQEIAWFDEINVTELSARLSKECQAITKALGEKMGMILLSLGMCVSGIFFAFFRGYLYSLVLLGFFPLIFIVSFLLTVAMQSGFS